ncbi:MAG: carboxylating nicotinate-nucleotide diphosphorylase [Puniceicoccales bacterium]
MPSADHTPTPESSSERRKRFRNHFYRQVRWSDLDPQSIAELIDRAAREDLEGAGFAERPSIPGDPTSELFLSSDQHISATLVARQPLTIAGLAMAPAILERFDSSLQIEFLAKDGDSVSPKTPLARVTGSAPSLFTAERTLLNFVQMLSGIATETRRLTRLLEGSPTRLLDTRKTHPGYRALIKYAVSAGGGWNHRLGLYDRIMLKDNHLAANSDSFETAFAQAIAKARKVRPDLPIEVEIDSLAQLPTVLAADPDMILFDNFSPEDIRKAVSMVQGRSLTEISGNVTAENLPAIAHLGVDFISTGATVHQSRWVDLGLDVEA